MNPEEIKALLADHQQWLGSETKEGKRADLSGANLEAADLHGANLRGANLRKANLSRCNLEGANLRGADLREANLQQAALSGTTLFEADLAGADLSNARGLLAGQLGGTNTSGAKLPEEVSQFKELDTVGELSRTAGALFLSLLVACFYACLTITATVAVHLLTNSTASKLPIIQTEIPIVVFYTAAPLVLLALYVCYHLYLQRLWEALAELPAVLPDGTTLDQKSYPMLLTYLVRAQFVQLRARRLPLFRLRERLSLLLASRLVPPRPSVPVLVALPDAPRVARHGPSHPGAVRLRGGWPRVLPPGGRNAGAGRQKAALVAGAVAGPEDPVRLRGARHAGTHPPALLVG